MLVLQFLGLTKLELASGLNMQLNKCPAMTTLVQCIKGLRLRGRPKGVTDALKIKLPPEFVFSEIFSPPKELTQGKVKSGRRLSCAHRNVAHGQVNGDHPAFSPVGTKEIARLASSFWPTDRQATRTAPVELLWSSVIPWPAHPHLLAQWVYGGWPGLELFGNFELNTFVHILYIYAGNRCWCTPGTVHCQAQQPQRRG